ncbi:Allergen [Penicillium canariense]|uniref:Allergen n=1 Tax=Penicillium canariense TaxID=189055 RepID=A0A9W9IDM6_9EURO|nr:Allergen [Penicillium canariense]KAJ5174718.1 Allergen [Penicillium canariense]
MLVKNSLLLAAALTAGSAVARLHGHERRHAHPKAEVEVQDASLPEIEAEVEKRAVGDVVTATIDGVLVTWINEWSGEAAASSSTSSVIQVPTTTAPAFTATPAAVESTVVPTPTPSTSSGGAWSDTPSSGEYSRSGFGGVSKSVTTGLLDWDYIGNVGVPWGSNIIEVEESAANQYKHVLRFEGSQSEPWTVLFWNTYGPNNKMDGFWAPNKALSFTLEPNEVKYVAIDDNSQGGWAASPGEVPTTNFGQYAATWGEFDMSSEKNDGFSGWDVSCIIAELNGLAIQGMRICNHLGQDCSSIGAGLSSLLNAYTKADQGNDHLAVAQASGPVRLVVQLDYA